MSANVHSQNNELHIKLLPANEIGGKAADDDIFFKLCLFFVESRDSAQMSRQTHITSYLELDLTVEQAAERRRCIFDLEDKRDGERLAAAQARHRVSLRNGVDARSFFIHRSLVGSLSRSCLRRWKTSGWRA